MARRFIPAESQILEMVRAGQWVRVPTYRQVHLVARLGTDAVCGRPLHPDLHEWVILAAETEAQCARCRGKDYS